MFACYEKQYTGNWHLVVYVQEKPPKSVNGNNTTRSAFFDVPASMVENGQPNLEKIKEAYPQPE